MDIVYKYVNNVLIIDISENDGKLSVDDISIFIKDILKINEGRSNRIAFDMTKKEYLNSSGLGELIKVKDHLFDEGIELILINPTARVESLLSMVGVDQFFHIASSEDTL